MVPLEALTSPVTVTDVATKSPSRLTLNGALPEFALPKKIPSSASATNIALPVQIVNLLASVSNTKLVAVKSVSLILNPPIVPPVSAVIVPCIVIAPSLSK